MEQRHKNLNGVWVKCRATVRKCPREHVSETEYQSTRDAPAGYATHEEAPLPPFDLEWGRLGRYPTDICVAPAGSSGQYCPKCDHYQPKDLYKSPGTEYGMITCFNCKEKVTFSQLGTDIRAEELKYISDSVVRKSHWFHITRAEDWVEDTQGLEAMVHLGSHEAAMIRLRDILHEDSYIDEDEGEEVPERYYLYEVSLKPDVEVAKGLFRDQEAGWPEYASDVVPQYSHATKQVEESGHAFFSASGVSRYLNAYEGAGTVSLLANATAYELVPRVEIPHPALKPIGK